MEGAIVDQTTNLEGAKGDVDDLQTLADQARMATI
jgi:hypothetical protein